jgi:hypothetical protein
MRSVNSERLGGVTRASADQYSRRPWGWMRPIGERNLDPLNPVSAVTLMAGAVRTGTSVSGMVDGPTAEAFKPDDG